MGPFRRVDFSMIVGIVVQPGRERDRPDVGVVGNPVELIDVNHQESRFIPNHIPG